jgi:SET domain-containing protein
MLLVKTYLGPSTIHGIGLFAAEPIARGTVIWRYDDRIDRRFTQAERDALPEPARSYIAIHAYPQRTGSDVYNLDGDNARFMNHSDTPNTDCTVDTIATCDIAAGEELVCDYQQFHPHHKFG